MKSFLISVVFIFSVFAFATPKDKVIASGQTSGEFVSFTWGDYGHIKIKANGKTLSYFVYGGPSEVFDRYSEELKGTKIKISWETALVHSEYAGGEIKMDRTTDICSFTPIKYTAMGSKVSLCK